MARRITVWEKPSFIVDSEFGFVPYNEWCRLEAERINKLGKEARVVTRKDGFVAVERMDLEEGPVVPEGEGR